MIDERTRQAERSIERTPEVFHRLLRSGMSEVEAERKMFGYAGIDVVLGASRKWHFPIPSRTGKLLRRQFISICNRHYVDLRVVPLEDAVRMRENEEFYERTLCIRCFSRRWLRDREVTQRARILSRMSVHEFNIMYPDQMNLLDMPVPRCALGLHPVGTAHCLACRWTADR